MCVERVCVESVCIECVCVCVLCVCGVWCVMDSRLHEILNTIRTLNPDVLVLQVWWWVCVCVVLCVCVCVCVGGGVCVCVCGVLMCMCRMGYFCTEGFHKGRSGFPDGSSVLCETHESSTAWRH